jgi:chromosome partitioning protein
MAVTAFLHQKGGTGKSTLAIAAAIALAGERKTVLLVDADPQGTVSEWGSRFGERFGVETHTHIQPNFPALLAPLRRQWPTILIDGPASLSEVTESILKASDRVIIPVRPSLPDLWALPWFAAIIRKLQREGRPLHPLLVFNMHRGERLEPLIEEMRAWPIPVWEEPIPADDTLAGLFAGATLTEPLAEAILRLVEEPSSAA